MGEHYDGHAKHSSCRCSDRDANRSRHGRHLVHRRQVEIAKAKLRLDHFDKRFAVYEAAGKFLGVLTTKGEATNEDFNEFGQGTRGASFLFGDQAVKAYLDELRTGAINLSMSKAALHQAGSNLDQERASDKYLALRTWVEQQYSVLDDKFELSLQLKA